MVGLTVTTVACCGWVPGATEKGELGTVVRIPVVVLTLKTETVFAPELATKANFSNGSNVSVCGVVPAANGSTEAGVRNPVPESTI
jgi:hypothetical protein